MLMRRQGPQRFRRRPMTPLLRWKKRHQRLRRPQIQQLTDLLTRLLGMFRTQSHSLEQWRQTRVSDVPFVPKGRMIQSGAAFVQQDLSQPKQPGNRQSSVADWARSLHTAADLLNAVAADMALHPEKFLEDGDKVPSVPSVPSTD